MGKQHFFLYISPTC